MKCYRVIYIALYKFNKLLLLLLLCVFLIVQFTFMCLVAKPLNGSEAKGGLVMMQTLLLFKYKSLCYCAN